MENEHIVSRFDKDLKKIKDKVLAMGQLVIMQLADATDALGAPDADQIGRIIKTDRKINGMNRTIANRAERLIALRQPMALDLRAALSPINIAGELERIGDHAKTTAKRARKMGDSPVPAAPLASLVQMSTLIQSQLHDVLTAYRASDAELAATIQERDRQVDALNKTHFANVVAALSVSNKDPEPLMNTILIARNFERVGDHSVNMARYVIHIVTGNDPIE